MIHGPNSSQTYGSNQKLIHMGISEGGPFLDSEHYGLFSIILTWFISCIIIYSYKYKYIYAKIRINGQ